MKKRAKRKDSDRNLFTIAETLDTRTSDYRGPALIKLLVTMMNKGSILDVGCGNGYYMNILRDAGFDVHGVEQSRSMIKKSEEIFGKMDIRKGLAEKMTDIFDEEFDNIVIIDVLEHIKDDNMVLKHMHKLLRKEGMLFVVVPAYPMLFCKRDAMYGHYRRYGKSELKAKVMGAGFDVLNLRYWSALTLPIYAAYSKLPIDMEKRYLKMRSKDGIVNQSLGWWFRNIENRVNFGFGVNLLCVGRKV
ncbi:MAG: class I SAM-dependent methyltransferase [Candidatus Aenigmatarchaeota archaeon]